MKLHTISTSYTEFPSDQDLPVVDFRLLREAKEIMKSAYAPYSNYLVGCAVLLENGEIVKGTNQENMAYPSGLCAERVALFSAGSRFPGVKIISMAISASPRNMDSNLPSASCGACRQVMLEYELNQKTPIRVLFQGKTGAVIVVEGVKDLLPLFFREDSLRNTQ